LTAVEQPTQSNAKAQADAPVRHSPIVVQTLNREMVRAYLQAEDYRFWTDQLGDFLVEFSYRDRIGGALTMSVRLEGASEDILAVSVQSDRRFIPERRGDLLELINTYHREYRWPKVSLWDDDGALRIDCETEVDLSSGVHERLLHELIDSAFAEGDAFWRWLTRRIRTGTATSTADEGDDTDEIEDEPDHPDAASGTPIDPPTAGEP
jgi:hypothetical protein